MDRHLLLRSNRVKQIRLGLVGDNKKCVGGILPANSPPTPDGEIPSALRKNNPPSIADAWGTL